MHNEPREGVRAGKTKTLAVSSLRSADFERQRAGLESTEWMEQVRLPSVEVVLFARQLHVLLSSGVTVPRSLEVLAEQAVRSDCAEVFYSLNRLIMEGRYLSAALSKFPSIFSPIFLGLLRVGEQTGSIVESTGLLANWLERDREVTSKVKGALVYPMIVVILASTASLGLMHVLGPVFLQMFSEQGRPLPWPTQIVANLVYVQRQPWFWVVLLALGVAAWRVLRQWGINPHWRLWCYRQAARMPALGPLLASAAWSRYCAALSILTHCGVQPQRAYRFAAEVSGDPRLLIDCDLLIQTIVNGESAPSHMEKRPDLYPALVSASLNVAEDTGKGKPILDYLGRLYRDDLEVRLEIMQSLLEPILLLATSSVLLFLILSLMLPLYGRLQDVA